MHYKYTEIVDISYLIFIYLFIIILILNSQKIVRKLIQMRNTKSTKIAAG